MNFVKLDAYDKSNRKLRHLMLSAALEESGAPGLILNTILATSVTVIFVVIWAALAEVEEMSVAPGTIAPVSKVRVVQHLEGGIITKLLVSDGQLVRKGQDLIVMAGSQALSDLQKLKARENALMMNVVRLNAYLEKEPLTEAMLIAAAKNYDNEDMDEIYKLAQTNMRLYEEKVRELNVKTQSLINKIYETERELEVIDAQIKNYRDQEVIISTEIGIYSELEKTSSVSVVSKLNAQERLKKSHDELLKVVALKNKSESQLYDLRHNLKEAESEFFTKAAQELNDNNNQLLEAQDAIEGAADRINRLNVVAPLNGIVKGLDAREGTVIQPGGTIMEVVPTDEPLEVDARVTTEDIGHIKIGDRVLIKVSTYNFAVYGQITGKVNRISATSFFDEKGVPYFKVKIKLDQNYVGHNPMENTLMPGMVVTADIHTGQKSLLVYLLKPVYRSLAQAFKER